MADFWDQARKLAGKRDVQPLGHDESPALQTTAAVKAGPGKRGAARPVAQPGNNPRARQRLGESAN